MLLVDDIDTLDDAVLSPLWERVARLDGLHLVASLEARSMSGYTTNPVDQPPATQLVGSCNCSPTTPARCSRSPG